MTSADLAHNELLAARKKEKLEWVTPRLTLMGAEDTESMGKSVKQKEETRFDVGPS